MIGDLAIRLRDLRDHNNWTVADMAERTGIPKRTLDKYILRQEASLPGFEALCALSKGLGVSLDWLVFGSESAGESLELFVDRAAYEVVNKFAETLIRYKLEGRSDLIGETSILGLTPEEWAADLGLRAGEFATELLRDGTSREQLMVWQHARTKRAWELLRDRTNAITSNSHPNKTATGN